MSQFIGSGSLRKNLYNNPYFDEAIGTLNQHTQPQGTNSPAEMEAKLKPVKDMFSNIGIIYLIAAVIVYAASYLISMIVGRYAIGLPETVYQIIQSLSMYGIGMPITYVLLSRVPTEGHVRERKMGFGSWFGTTVSMYAVSSATIPITNGIMYVMVGIVSLKDTISMSLVPVIATSGVRIIRSDWMSYLAVLIAVAVVAPITEEIWFRKWIIDRTIKYGEGVSVLVSALMFGVFHGNFQQAVFAFAGGLFMGYTYVKTGRLRYSIIMHAALNFLNTISSVISGYSEFFNRYSDESDVFQIFAQMSGSISTTVVALIEIFLWVVIIVGAITFLGTVWGSKFIKTRFSVPKGYRFSTYLGNWGMIAYFLFWFVMFAVKIYWSYIFSE